MHFREKGCALCKLVPFSLFYCENVQISLNNAHIFKKMHENACISKDLYPPG